MNYRHIFHAGNICDTVKHVVLTRLMGHLHSKDKPFCVLDTHAGIGLYDLTDSRALKTGEAQDGIFKLIAASPLPALADYYRILRKLNRDWPHVRFYPGSPVIVRQMLRPQDRLIACELHPEDAEALRCQFRNDRQAHIHLRDGYDALSAFLPPPEKRGLVLIDPPFEERDEFEKLATALKAAHSRWAAGIFMLWYPIKDRPAIWRFHEAMVATGIPKQLVAEFTYDEAAGTDQLIGCGFLLINPPWKLDEELGTLFPALHEALATKHRGASVKWLTAA